MTAPRKPPTKKPTKKDQRFAVYLGIGVLVLCCGGVASFFDGGDDEQEQQRPAPVVVVASTSAGVAPGTPQVTATPSLPATTKPSPTPDEDKDTDGDGVPDYLDNEPNEAWQPPPVEKPKKNVYYRNCAAAEADGAAPLYEGEPGYRKALDRDGDGDACE